MRLISLNFWNMEEATFEKFVFWYKQQRVVFVKIIIKYIFQPIILLGSSHLLSENSRRYGLVNVNFGSLWLMCHVENPVVQCFLKQNISFVGTEKIQKLWVHHFVFANKYFQAFQGYFSKVISDLASKAINIFGLCM